MKDSRIYWNNKVKLVLADVDETIADVYTPADPKMIFELSTYIENNGKLFLVTGGSLQRVLKDIIDFMPPNIRRDIIISHCSGAEVWGFTKDGILLKAPFYSLYEDKFSVEMKKRWRRTVAELVEEFELRTHQVRPKIEFWKTIGRNPRDIMLDDRGPQITLEIVNGHDLSSSEAKQFHCAFPLTHDGRRDLRIPLMQRAGELFAAYQIPVSPRLGGVFALDFAIEGSSKTTSINYVLENPKALETIGLKDKDLTDPLHLEVWGDKFSKLHGGTDRHISEALPPTVRSIDFREEDPKEFPDGYNIVLWNGTRHLHDGLLEYLQSRHALISG